MKSSRSSDSKVYRRGVTGIDLSRKELPPLKSKLEGPYILPLFSIRAYPVPPVLANEEDNQPELKSKINVDHAEMLETLTYLKNEIDRLSSKRSMPGKKQTFTAKEIKELAIKLGISAANRKKNELIEEIKEKMREKGFLED